MGAVTGVLAGVLLRRRCRVVRRYLWRARKHLHSPRHLDVKSLLDGGDGDLSAGAAEDVDQGDGLDVLREIAGSATLMAAANLT